MFTSIVIPTYNNYDQLADCIQSIKDNTPEAHEIIIMDNGSGPLGYVDPTVRGMRASRGDLIAVINDDLVVGPGWLPPLIEEAEKGTWAFSPDVEGEENMKLVGWFLCFTQDGYQRLGGFDAQFEVWCADVDLIKRLELYGQPYVKVPGVDVTHQYSQTTSQPDIQEVIVPMQQRDLERYKAKWGTDPNRDKIV